MQLTRFVLVVACVFLAACGTSVPTEPLIQPDTPTAMYRIGPLDNL